MMLIALQAWKHAAEAEQQGQEDGRRSGRPWRQAQGKEGGPNKIRVKGTSPSATHPVSVQITGPNSKKGSWRWLRIKLD